MRSTLVISQICAFATVALWSTAYVYTKVALESFSVSSLAFLRCAVASVCLCSLMLGQRKRPPGLAMLPRFLIAGATGFGLYVLVFNEGSITLNPTTSCIIISTAPIITAFLARLRFGERLTPVGWAAMVSAFGGILVMTLWDGVIAVSMGVAWMLAAAFLISAYNVLQRELSRDFSALEITAWSFLAGTLLLLPFAPAALAEVGAASAAQNGLVLFLGIFPSAAAYLLWAKALSVAPKTSHVSNYMFLTPFLALLLEYWVTGALPGTGTFVGGAVILASLACFAISGKRKTAEPVLDHEHRSQPPGERK